MSNWLENKQLTIQPFVRDDGTWVWITSGDMGFLFGGTSDSASTALFIVETGFETDLGSIPRWLRWLFNPADPQCARAYVLHDWINQLTAQRPPGHGVWSSIAAAAVLYDALRLDGCTVRKATVITVGVFIGIAKKER